MTMMAKPVRAPSTSLRIVSLSDVHLYHPRVPDEHIIESLDGVFCEDGTADSIDIVFIAGDLFDRGVPFGDDAITPILAWQLRLLTWAARHDIVLRVLNGTPRHDRKQSARFQDLIDGYKIDVDFKFVKTLSIEYIERFGVNVLYVPDEWRTDPAVTLQEVRELMAANHLKTVNYAVMHGCFGFQLPPIESVQIKAHDTKAYLELVSEHIFIGHHHVFSVHEHIVAHGSLTRLAQGEPAPKGYVVYDLMDDGSYQLTFVENKGAWTFKSIDASEMDYLELVGMLSGANYRKGSYIEIVADPISECSRLYKQLTREFGDINLTLARPKAKQKVQELEVEDRAFASVQIHEQNATEYITAWLGRKGVDDALIQRCAEVLVHEQSLLT